MREFSLNYKGSQVIIFESTKSVLYSWKNNDEYEIITVKTEIQREKHQPGVYTIFIEKYYGVVCDKRRVLDTFATIAFGYRKKRCVMMHLTLFWCFYYRNLQSKIYYFQCNVYNDVIKLFKPM